MTPDISHRPDSYSPPEESCAVAVSDAVNVVGPAVAPKLATSIELEAQLIRRILDGENELYLELVSPYQRSVYLMAYSRLKNEADAEECTQDAILKAFHHLAKFRGECKFGSWLIRIALNEAAKTFRKLRPGVYESIDSCKDQDGDYAPQHFGDWREIPSEALERKEVRDILAQALQDLPEIYRQVFILRDVDENDIATTAQILGVSESVVKIRLLRARLRMRDLVTPFLKNSTIFSRPFFKRVENLWR